MADKTNILEQIIEQYQMEFKTADGLDDAVIGVEVGSGQYKIVYSCSKCVEVLVKRDGMTHEEAQEFLEFNTYGAYVGEDTPIFMDDELSPNDSEDVEDLEKTLMMIHHAFANDTVNLTQGQKDAVESMNTSLSLRGKIKWDIGS